MPRTETQRIADQLDRAVKGPAWHGPSLLQTVAGVSARQASARPIAGAHSIWELVAHATTWLEITRQRLTGTAPRRITRSMDWPPVGSSTRQWRQSVAAVRRAAQKLRSVILALDDERLRDELPGSDDTWSIYITLHGVIQHVLYHAGQIAILKKGAQS